METLLRIGQTTLVGTAIVTVIVLAWIALGIGVARLLGFDPKEPGVGLTILSLGAALASAWYLL